MLVYVSASVSDVTFGHDRLVRRSDMPLQCFPFEKLPNRLKGGAMKIVWDVRIPETCNIVKLMNGNLQVSEMHVSNPRPIQFTDPHEAVTKSVDALQYVDVTESVAIAAVKANGLALKYVPQTPVVVRHSVTRWPWSLEHVIDQTDELCLCVVKSHWWAIRYVRCPTHELVSAAVSQYAGAIKHVSHQ